ncbi:MAG TPA: M23 family metallopeptidase [Anaerolineales bacterium]|nr:M23 family metallopeptidase [Anaerolineales bacterium]
MSSDKYLDEFPDAEEDTFQREPRGKEEKENRLAVLWESITRAGLSETVFRAGTNLLLIVVVILVVVAMRAFSQNTQNTSGDVIIQQAAVLAAPLPTATPPPAMPALPPFFQAQPTYAFGIPRLALLHTTIPTRPRTEVTTYTVEEGDTIFGIAEKFGLNPETVLWSNYYTLADNPHSLRPGQELNILPLNGTYHRWSEGEGLNGVARGYNVTPEEIINWPANHLDAEALGDWSHPNIEPGTMLVVPGGSREFITWSASRITRDNPGVARVYGPGFCGTITDGAVGTGWFVWPANNHFLSGYDYSPSTNHRAVDVDGDMGDPIYAADNGVVVYSGWNDHGYGYMVVIDHGNGWQTLYAHMSAINAGCGASVYQGGVIGAFGSTGNSTGPHLHFEMMHDIYGKVNPWDFLP